MKGGGRFDMEVAYKCGGWFFDRGVETSLDTVPFLGNDAVCLYIDQFSRL